MHQPLLRSGFWWRRRSEPQQFEAELHLDGGWTAQFLPEGATPPSSKSLFPIGTRINNPYSETQRRGLHKLNAFDLLRSIRVPHQSYFHVVSVVKQGKGTPLRIPALWVRHDLLRDFGCGIQPPLQGRADIPTISEKETPPSLLLLA